MLCCVILCLCGSWQTNSGFPVTPLGKTRTVKRGVRITATIDIFPALILQRFIHNRLYRFVAELLHGQILVDQLHIKHIPVVITPATIFTDCYRVRIGHFCTAGFILCEILCKIEAVLFPVLRHIVCIATTIVIRLNDHVNVIHTFGFKKVLLIDADPQGSLTASLGYEEPDDLRITLATIMMDVINEEEISLKDGILHHQENVDLLPANIELSALEVTMGNVMSREMIMKEYIDAIRGRYDYILIDCMPSLGMMTINALVSSDSVLIPVQAAYLPVKGLQQLIKTILTVKKRLNRKLAIEGILLTMVDFRTNYARDIASRVHTTYGSQIEVFENVIPMSVKAAETSAEGKSIYMHCPKGKVAEAYKNLTQEVLKNEK